MAIVCSFLWQLCVRFYGNCVFVSMAIMCSFLWQLCVRFYGNCVFVSMAIMCSFLWQLCVRFYGNCVFVSTAIMYTIGNIHSLSLGAYPRQDVAAQMSLRNCFRSSATLLAAVIVPNVSVMSFSHLCLGFPRLLFPATIPCIIVFSKPLCRVTWPKYLSFCRLTKLYIQFVGR